MTEQHPDRPVRVLIVCTANIARSPLAEVMLQSALAASDLRFASAGVRAWEGDPASRQGIALAARRDLDLTGHRSMPASAEGLEWADLVLTMTEKHRDHCVSIVPEVTTRTFTLREFVRLLDEASPGVTFLAGASTGSRLVQLRDAAHAARERGSRPAEPEDIADPIGRGEVAWQALDRDLGELVGRIERSVRSVAT